MHVGTMYVDGVNIGDPDDAALRDRRDISADGIFIVVVTVSSDDGAIVADPEVHPPRRRLPRQRADKLIEELKDMVEDALDEAAEARHPRVRADPGGPARLDRQVRLAAPARRPMILPVVIQV